jgi:ferritin-like protein
VNAPRLADLPADVRAIIAAALAAERAARKAAIQNPATEGVNACLTN